MKPAVLLTVVLAGCSQFNPLPPPDPPVVVLEVPQPKPEPIPTPVPKEVVVVAQQYQNAALKEKEAALSPDATPVSVRSVHTADIRARTALRTLERQGHHPTDAALAEAKSAVRHLANVLDNAP